MFQGHESLIEKDLVPSNRKEKKYLSSISMVTPSFKALLSCFLFL